MKAQISNSTLFFFFTCPDGTRPDAQLQTDTAQSVPVLNKISRFSLFRSRDWLSFLAEKEAMPGRFFLKKENTMHPGETKSAGMCSEMLVSTAVGDRH